MSHKKILFITIGTILGVLVLSAVLSYATKFRDPFTVAFKRFYPAAFVGGRMVSVNDLEQAGIVGEKLGVKNSEARDKLIQTEKSIVLAQQLNVSAPKDASTDELRFYSKGAEAEYQDILKNVYNGSDHFFYKYSVTPQVVDSYLRMKYYSDTKTSSPAYQKALAVLERLDKGEKFEDLAKSESDDKITGQIGGDLGFYEPGQILPELEDQISISQLGEVRKDVIITRLGYHLIYPMEQSTESGKKLWHAKHMLFVPTGYDTWLKQNLDKISAKSFWN